MLDDLLQSFTTYYGLDWGAMLLGMIGYFLVTNRNRLGFLLSMCGCLCGFGVAMISDQYGFIVYNLILISMQTRGFVLWGQKAAPVPVRARSNYDVF